MTELLIIALAAFGGTEFIKNYVGVSRPLKSALAAVVATVVAVSVLQPWEWKYVWWIVAGIGGAFLVHRLYRILRMAADHHLQQMIRNRR